MAESSGIETTPQIKKSDVRYKNFAEDTQTVSSDTYVTELDIVTNGYSGFKTYHLKNTDSTYGIKVKIMSTLKDTGDATFPSTNIKEEVLDEIVSAGNEYTWNSLEPLKMVRVQLKRETASQNATFEHQFSCSSL